MKIATWNVNSIRARLDNVVTWLKETSPDVACLQEIKTVEDTFPREVLEDLGYNVAIHGQKSYNGVAMLSKKPFEDVCTILPGDDSDEQARFLQATISTDDGALTVASIYAPNGNPVESEKYPYKLNWMKRLHAHAQEMLKLEECFVIAGDYNVIPHDDDVHNPESWREDALFRPETLEHYHSLLNLGLTDAYRACEQAAHQYTFWDYQAGAWPKDHGIRIDHHLLSPQAADRLKSAGIDRFTRGWQKASDHVPIWIELDI